VPLALQPFCCPPWLAWWTLRRRASLSQVDSKDFTVWMPGLLRHALLRDRGGCWCCSVLYSTLQHCTVLYCTVLQGAAFPIVRNGRKCCTGLLVLLLLRIPCFLTCPVLLGHAPMGQMVATLWHCSPPAPLTGWYSAPSSGGRDGGGAAVPGVCDQRVSECAVRGPGAPARDHRVQKRGAVP